MRINNNKFKIKVQTSPKELRTGMMFKTFDETFNGMLFVKPLEKHCFIMKNCLIPLDIIFINEDTITKIHHNCQPSNEDDTHYCGYGNYIFEVEGGTCKNLGIKKGDKVTLPRYLKVNSKNLKNFINIQEFSDIYIKKNRTMKITLTELRQLVKSIIKEEMGEGSSEMPKEAKALETLQTILTPSDIEFLKKEYSKLGKKGLADEVKEVMQLSEMEDLNTYRKLDPKEKKIRSIINKVIQGSGVISMLGIVPAAMISGGAGLGLGIAALAAYLLKDAAYWNRKGGINYDAWEDENR